MNNEQRSNISGGEGDIFELKGQEAGLVDREHLTRADPEVACEGSEERTSERVLADNDSAKTPRGEGPPVSVDWLVEATLAAGTVTGPAVDNKLEPTPAGVAPSTMDRHAEGTGAGHLIPPASAPEYFGVQGNEVPETSSRPDTVSTNSTLSSPLHSAGPSSSSLQSSTIPGLPHSTSADSTELFSRLIRVQSNLSAQSSRSRGTAGRHSSRHSRQEPSVSSPLSLSLSFSKPRSANEGPNYPDQSFAALQRQPYTPPYSYFRSHSPFVYQGSPQNSSPNQSEEFILSPTNRTGGSTPVDSPLLFSASVRRGRVMEDEMVSSQYQAPALHPTHHTAPKESHSLRKDYDAISGHKLINEYEILSEIGQGTHGKVKLARRLNQANDGNFVAIKIVKRFRQKSLRLGGRETQEDKVKKEIAVLKKARHSHVVSLIEVIDDPQSDKVYMVLEYVEEGEMKWRRKADKWTVDFERRRVEQEMLAWQHGEQVDLHREGVEIEDFNSRAEWRVHEKARQLASQKQRAFEAISSRRSSSGTVFTDDELGSHDVEGGWSLEHGGESDTDLPEIPVSRRMSRMTLNSPGTEEIARRLGPYGFPAAAKSTDGIFRDPWVSGSDPGSPALSTVGGHLINTIFPESVEKDQNFQRELKMIRKLDDANTFSEEDEHYRHVPCLTTARARECFRDTVLGLEYLHYQGIIHRDIKPANLLWDRNHRVKISDFGVSYLGRGDEEDANPDIEVRDDDIELAKTVGTPAFYAPELCDPDLFLEGNEKRRNIGTPMDIWALGVTLYCMIFARLPFAHSNQIKLFELIAKQELFIPSKRLRAVRLNKRETPEPRDRPDDVLQYEEIGDELTDLLKRMLHKDPRQRITIREIKRHPWVVKGMLDPLAWIDKTDPATYGKGRKINVTAEDVHAAIAPLTFVEKLRNFKQRMSSLVRGRNPSKHPESRSGQSGSASSRSVDPSRKNGRRASLRGDDINSILRSRPEVPSAGEHPLSRSQLASPSQEQPENYFVPPHHETASSSGAGTPAQQHRPSQPDRGPSTAESIKTIRPRRPSRSDFMKYSPWYDGPADEPSSGSFEDTPTSHPASITHRFGGTSRTNFSVSSKKSNVSMSSSNSTSSDRISSNYEDPHTLPLVGVSSAVAKGRVQSPLTSHLEHAPTSSPQIGRSRARAVTAAPRLSSSNEAFAQAQLQNIRREQNDIALEQASARRARSRPHSRSALECPLSPDDEIFLARQRHLPSFSTTASSLSRPSSASQHGFSAISSSDDVRAEAAFSDNSRHPSMPSVVSASSATSASGSIDEHVLAPAEKHNPELRLSREALMSTGETVTPAAAKGLYAMMQTASSGEERIMQGVQEPTDKMNTDTVREDDDENGYNGDHDGDEDSDDEGIVFGGLHR